MRTYPGRNLVLLTPWSALVSVSICKSGIGGRTTETQKTSSYPITLANTSMSCKHLERLMFLPISQILRVGCSYVILVDCLVSRIKQVVVLLPLTNAKERTNSLLFKSYSTERAPCDEERPLLFRIKVWVYLPPKLRIQYSDESAVVHSALPPSDRHDWDCVRIHTRHSTLPSQWRLP